jgi:alanine racemase
MVIKGSTVIDKFAQKAGLAPSGKVVYTFLPMDTYNYSTWLEVDLGAIRNNVRRLRQITGRPVMAVVKANGYGHGMVQAARAAVEAGASWCGVSRVEEALTLRQSGLGCQALVLGYTPPACISDAILGGVSVTVYDVELARQYAAQAAALQAGGATMMLRLHIKVDTGMGRLGIEVAEAAGFIAWLGKQPGLMVEGVFTHFARADEPDEDLTSRQVERFEGLLAELKHLGLRPPLVHAANSAGSLAFPQSHYDLVRPGIAMYGLHPSPQAPLPDGFQPALTWKADLTSVKVLPPGHGVSYGSIYTTHRSERIGIIPIGYADGYRRVEGQEVLVCGQRAPVVGRVCMDQCAVQLDGVPEAKIGDEVVVLGRQGQDSIPAEEIGARWGTVNYEVVCGLANRLPRIYLP